MLCALTQTHTHTHTVVVLHATLQVVAAQVLAIIAAFPTDQNECEIFLCIQSLSEARAEHSDDLPGFVSDVLETAPLTHSRRDHGIGASRELHVVASAMVEDAALVIPAGNRLIVVPRLQDWRDGWPHEEGWATADTG
jgi:hypothetical protein